MDFQTLLVSIAKDEGEVVIIMLGILICMVLVFYMLRLKKKIESFTRKGEVRFWCTYIKKSPEKKTLKETKNMIIHTFANYSWYHKIIYWTARILIECGYYGGCFLFIMFVGFHLNRRIGIIAFGLLLLATPPLILFFNQIYYFWKKQPIWHERPVEEQPFLLPTEKDFKIINKYWIQLMVSFAIIMIIGIHLLS